VQGGIARCPPPHAAAQPSMIEDRDHAARESPSASLTARTAWYPQRAPQARLHSPNCGYPGRYLQVARTPTLETGGSLQKLRVRRYFRRAGSAITVGISTFGAASPKALNCSGFRNITEHREQA
jgi:hypothetical protein